MAIVIDSSVVVDFLVLRRQPSLKGLFADHDLHSLQFLGLEFLNALRRLERLHVVDVAMAQASVEHLAALTIRQYPHEPLTRAIWELRHNLSAYDAAHVALAQELDLPLVTADRRLARAAAGVCDVIVPEEVA